MYLNSEPLFVVRQEEINKIFESLRGNNRVTLINGDSGIGKTTVLNEFRKMLWKNHREDYFVGYYDETDERKSGSILYPFITVLKRLLNWIISRESVKDKIKETIGRVEKAFIKFVKEKGSEIAGAIIQDIAEKLGFKETFKIAKDFLGMVRAEQSVVMLAENYVSAHRDEAIFSYIDIFQSLHSEFKIQSFVLIFDQFESVGKASLDFLIDFLKNLPVRVHAIISLGSDDIIWDDSVSRKLSEYATHMIKKQGAMVISFEGLSSEIIHNWIKYETGKDLPFIPDVERIKENTGGFPILLDEWIKQSKDLNYLELEKPNTISDRRRQLYEYIIQRKKSLSGDSDVIKKLNRISVLTRRLPNKDLAVFLKIEIDDLEIFLDKLTEQRIFDKKNGHPWFRHGLIQKCLEESLTLDYTLDCHRYALDYYTTLMQNEQKMGYVNNDVFIGYAYHLYKAGNGMREESISVNKDLAHRAVNIGELDLAERCYRRIIDQASKKSQPQDFIEGCLGLAHNVFVTWGRYNEAYDIYEQLLDKLPNDLKLRAKIISYMAQIHYIFREYDSAIKLYNESLLLIDKTSDQPAKAGLLHGKGMVYYDKKEYDKALRIFEEARDIGEAIKNSLAIISSKSYIANIYRTKKRYDEALHLFNDCLERAEKIENLHSVSEMLHGMANVYYDMQEYDKALEILDRKLAIENRLGNQAGIAISLLNMGKTLNKKGLYRDALRRIQEAHLKLKRLDLPDVQEAADQLDYIQNMLKNNPQDQ